MRVKILKGLAGPARCCSPGEVIDLPADEARRYIEAGAAVSLEPPPRATPVEPEPIEMATAEPDTETPTPRPRRRGRKRA